MSEQGTHRDCHFHPFGDVSALERAAPFTICRGEGVYVFDDAGNRYLDALGGLWCASLGFSEQRLVYAATRQMTTLPYASTFGNKSHPVVEELASRLVAMLPGNMAKVFFNNSGSEAVDTAVKMVWHYNNGLGRPLKKKIISRQGSYHGTTVASASLTGLPMMHAAFDLPLPQVRHTDCPHYWRYGLPGESEEAFATRLADNLEALIVAEGPETIAAFIAEPIQGAGGVVLPPATYFEKVQKVLRKYDILFVVDEVICGFGRTGRAFGSHLFDLAPDIVIVAKGLSAAYLPISGTAVSKPVFDVLSDTSKKLAIFWHGFTYSGHPVCAAVALETLKIYEERRIFERVLSIGPRLQKGWRRFTESPIVGDVRGVGLIGGFDLVADKGARQDFPPQAGIGGVFEDAALRHGVILRGRGDRVVVAPPLTISEDEIDELLEGVALALAETERYVRQIG